MNQNLIFGDDVTALESAVRFSAQQQGQVIQCLISFSSLTKLSSLLVTVNNAVTVFEQIRFDIEELAEKAIKDELFEDDGSILL
ncbi:MULTISPECIES: DUF1488 domain-containing protein [Shewanella]|uniref:DUF1488 domain-containing protein n=1 Tax=Shewanella holmiensis TaxID=2952222 RepID=A0A9X2WPB2_9GAMM|nr:MULTISPECIES: DUF1488 domain-containing protein [Shewanella]MCT7942850.1 DUF1488 domain-containing protein [Shewanella holmiensis]MDP5147439.1 DUF1488 domain-containing protein [Shewanella sp. ULN5]